MPRGLNKVTLMGNLGQEPETRHMPSGDAVTNIRIATSERWNDRNTGEAREETEWHSVVFMGRRAEIAAEYLRKGSRVYVEGKLKTRKWTDKDGNTRHTTEIVGREMEMLDARPVGPSGQSKRVAGSDVNPNGEGGDPKDLDIPF